MSTEVARLSPVLIANRGEIAVRVARSVHRLGLEAVAVFTAADQGAPHVIACDRAARIDHYLDPVALTEAAELLGARSVHPGYGFLSESSNFARAVLDAGLAWVGPPPAAIELMGDKARSKELAREVGVPVVPGTASAQASAEEIAAFAGERGLPILVKAVAGGGGKGMRVVRREEELAGAVEAAAREAEAAFGDGRLLAERYLERPRHVEVQVLADRHGAVIHLGERECSLQRRHQKVIEEAPSPVVDEEMRERMGRAAVELARACSYEGAGTVELLVPAGGGEFHFLEMNTRLQVEHPVTEMVWDVDLVEQQLRVAAGEPLDPGLAARRLSGHAVEARLYAEDPAAGFLPAGGEVLAWEEPRGEGIRVDSGIGVGTVVGTAYDPMLAKLIAHGPDRPTALRRLRRSLGELELLGVRHSAALCRELLGRADVAAGEQDTGLLERVIGELGLDPPDDLLAAAAMAIHLDDTGGEDPTALGPWRRSFERLGEVRLREGRLEAGDRSWTAGDTRRIDDDHLLVELDGVARRYAVARAGSSLWIGREGHQLEARLAGRAGTGVVAPAGSLEAPMPGTVLAVAVEEGQRVEEGDLLLVLESMKMELEVTAPHAGTVRSLSLAGGDRVVVGEVLVAVAPDEDDSDDEEEEGR